VYSTVKTTTIMPAEPVDIAMSQDGEWTFVLLKGGRLAIYGKDGSLNDTVMVDKHASRIALSVTGDRMMVASGANRKVQEVLIDFVRKINIKGSPYLGPEDAPVTLVLFSDFQCPYCARLDPQLMTLLDEFPEDLKIVYKNFPIRGHRYAVPAALAALAAARQGKFWPFHDELFATAKLDMPAIDAIARKLKLDLKKFGVDRNSEEVRRELQRDFNDGRSIGVRGTPTLFINGRKVRDRDMDNLRKLIRQAIAEKKGKK
jgi:protein-disulfide isomerase